MCSFLIPSILITFKEKQSYPGLFVAHLILLLLHDACQVREHLVFVLFCMDVQPIYVKKKRKNQSENLILG